MVYMLTEPWFTVYMKSAEELLAIAVRVRRGTRNTEPIDLCDGVEELLARPKYPRRDRKEYMRDYMRHWRAERKQKKVL